MCSALSDDIKLTSTCRRLVYVIVREEITGPIINSQVIDVLERISHRSDSIVNLLWFYRVDRIFGNERSIKKIKRDLSNRGIRLLPVPFIGWRFPADWWLLPALLPQWLAGLLWVYWVHGVRIFHCRSYHAALAAAIFGTIFSTRFLFDPRSPFPEENLAAGRWKKGMGNFSFWKRTEAWLCRSATTTTGVSAPFVEALQTAAPMARFVIIPNNYPASFSVGSQDAAQAVDIGKSDHRIVIGYIGTLGHWNDAALYVRFLEDFFRHAPPSAVARFIVQGDSRAALELAIQDATFKRHRLEIESLPQGEVFGRLTDCTIGLQLMRRPDDRLSIKFVEYIAAGVPVVVSANVRGAAEVVRREGVGLVLEDGRNSICAAIDFATKVLDDREAWRQKCRTLADAEFSIEAVADKLAGLYSSFAPDMPEPREKLRNGGIG